MPALAGAQVAADSVYQGRLTNDSGAPLAGPVQLTLRIYDVATAGSPHYSEDHLGVVVDTNGLFSVRLGTGASSVGTYDPNLFSVTPRFLEIEVNGQVLSPRQAVGSVPTALVAADIVIDPSSNIGTAVANAQAAADAAAASHTVDTTLAEAAVDAFVSNNGYGSALQIQRLARGWNLTRTSVSISTEVFNASGCTRNGLSFSCNDVLDITSMGFGVGDPCDSSFSPPFAAFNTRDFTTKNRSCSNN